MILHNNALDVLRIETHRSWITLMSSLQIYLSISISISSWSIICVVNVLWLHYTNLCPVIVLDFYCRESHCKALLHSPVPVVHFTSICYFRLDSNNRLSYIAADTPHSNVIVMYKDSVCSKLWACKLCVKSTAVSGHFVMTCGSAVAWHQSLVRLWWKVAIHILQAVVVDSSTVHTCSNLCHVSSSACNHSS